MRSLPVLLMRFVVMVLLVSNGILLQAQVEINDFEVDHIEYQQKYRQAKIDSDKNRQAELLEIIVKDYNAQGKWDSVYKYNNLIAEVQLALGNKERYLNAFMINISIERLLPNYDVDQVSKINEISKYMEDLDLHMFRRSEIAAFVSNYLFYNVDRDSSIVLMDKAIDYAETEGVDKHYAIGHRRQKAIFLNAMGRYDEAIGELLIAIDRKSFSLNSAYLRWGVLDELGDMFFDIQDYAKSEEYYNKCIRIAQDNSYKFSEAYSTMSLAKLKLVERKFDEAKFLFEKSLPIFMKKKKYLDASSAFIGLAEISLANQNLFGAQLHLTSIESNLNKDIGKKNENNRSRVIGNYNLLKCDFYFQKLDFINLRKVLTNIKADTLFYKELEVQKEVSLVEYKLAKAKNKDSDALKHFENYVSIKNRIDKSSSEMRVQLLESQFNRQEQDQKISVLDAVTEEQKKSLAIRNKALIIGGVMLAFLAGLLIGIYRLFKKNKEYQAKLETQNVTIQKALAENKVLIKEIHHRVKNNLQVISSLLSLQERKVTDENTKEALKSSKTRVETMSILHQSLYQGDEVRGIGVKEYFSDLINNLVDTYTVNDNITTSIDIDNLKIDVDSMIPLGLVANELICNAIKHGIGDALSGHISISLKDMGDQVILSVTDSGGKLTDNKLKLKEGSLGVKLINAFANRLDGKLEVESGESTKVSLIVNKENINFIDE